LRIKNEPAAIDKSSKASRLDRLAWNSPGGGHGRGNRVAVIFESGADNWGGAVGDLPHLDRCDRSQQLRALSTLPEVLLSCYTATAVST